MLEQKHFVGHRIPVQTDGVDFCRVWKQMFPLAKMCQALGIEIDMSLSAHGMAYVRNTPNRVAELSEAINTVVCKGTIP